MKKVEICIKAKAQPAEAAALLIRLLDTLIADCRLVNLDLSMDLKISIWCLSELSEFLFRLIA